METERVNTEPHVLKPIGWKEIMPFQEVDIL